MTTSIWDSVITFVLNKDMIFFALFLYMLWVQQVEKKDQNVFIRKQQTILDNLTSSFEKLAQNQEKLTERIERIEYVMMERKN